MDRNYQTFLEWSGPVCAVVFFYLGVWAGYLQGSRRER